MTQEEQAKYQELSAIQKDFVDALKNLGFTWKYFNTYCLTGWGEVDVSKFSRWSDLLKYVHEQGKDQKRFEFLRLLGI